MSCHRTKKRGREESNLHRAAPKTADLPLVNTRECHVGVEPTSPGWRPGTFAARPMAHTSNARRKERESNSQGSYARSASNGEPSPIGLPFHIVKAPAAGIEPASGRLTVAFPYQHRTHRSIYNSFMNTSHHIDGTVIDARFRTVTVEADDGTTITALVPQRWFSVRGRSICVQVCQLAFEFACVCSHHRSNIK